MLVKNVSYILEKQKIPATNLIAFCKLYLPCLLNLSCIIIIKLFFACAFSSFFFFFNPYTWAETLACRSDPVKLAFQTGLLHSWFFEFGEVKMYGENIIAKYWFWFCNEIWKYSLWNEINIEDYSTKNTIYIKYLWNCASK